MKKTKNLPHLGENHVLINYPSVRMLAASATFVRLPEIDIARGLALIAMIIYHLCFDLNYFGWIQIEQLRDPFWLWLRTLILGSFLLLAGISLHLRLQQQFSPQRWWRRWAHIAGAALLVSVASYVMFPQTYIYFGVLHFIAVTLLLAWPLRQVLAQCPSFFLLGLGTLIGCAPYLWSDAIFNPRSLNWLGFTTILPRTEDYVPLFPWLALILWGIVLGRQLPNKPPRKRSTKLTKSLSGQLSYLLSWLGQRSLLVYLLHQPLLMAILTGLNYLRH